MMFGFSNPFKFKGKKAEKLFALMKEEYDAGFLHGYTQGLLRGATVGAWITRKFMELTAMEPKKFLESLSPREIEILKQCNALGAANIFETFGD